MFGTIILWILAIIGVLAPLFWVYAYFFAPIKKINKEKNKRTKGTKNN